MKKSRAGGTLIGNYGLAMLTVAVFVLFAILLPETYPTGTNIRSILVNQAIPALVAIGISIPIVAQRFDLSVGYLIGLVHVAVMWLLVNTALPWPVIALVMIVGSAVFGIINGLLVEFANIDSFIATLGTGSVAYALTGWITDGARIVPGPNGLPESFTSMANGFIFGIPYTFFYVILVAFILWVCLEHLPVGRHMYVVGANPLAAQLVGIKKHRVVIYTFAGSSVVTAIAGVLLAGQQQIGDPSIGLSYLLPAFVGALLGSTTIRPGRANAAGTLIAVAILAIGLSGLQQLGAKFWVTPLFNGLTLLAAVGLAGFASRRRQKARVVVGGDSSAAPPLDAAAESIAAEHGQ